MIMKPNQITNSTKVVDKNALLKLSEIGLPTKKTESYRNFDITSLLSDEYNLEQDAKYNNYFKNKDFITIFVKNGQIDTVNSDITDAIEFKSEQKSKITTTNSLYYLSEILLENQQTILVKKETEKPIKIVNQLFGEKNFIANHLHLEIEENVNANIVEVFDDNCLENSFINGNRTLHVKSNAQLDYTKIQVLKPSNSMILNYIPQLEKDASSNVSFVDLGADISLNICDVKLECNKSEISFNNIIKTGAAKQSGNIATMHHIVESTTSSFISKHILKDEASALFEVRSIVEEDAKFSKTFQNSQTILLDNGPKINAIPQLILHTDELEAAHGATSGSLDVESLYYLMSRGISEEVASQMLINAIEQQVVNTIKNESIQALALEFLKR